MIRIMKAGEVPSGEILKRASMPTGVEDTVREIIDNVRKNGDRALLEYTEKFDRVRLSAFRVSKAEMTEAAEKTDPSLVSVIEKAADNIRKFHINQKREGFSIKGENGAILGQRVIPIEKAGLYVPGGTAAYPSTVLMDSIPAKIAGCRKVVMVTPPDREGKVNPALLVAARVAGIDEIYKVGGAQAIAALAYGTESIPKVDKIVGPGNAFVAEAKKQVFGTISIDMIAGPSEILVIADGTSDPEYLAADLLSQAEHDRNATAVLVTDSEKLAYEVADEIEKQLVELERYEIAKASIENNGKIIITKDLEAAVETANELAPEHLELSVEDPFRFLDSVKNAGSVFLGKYCPEALGDYLAGPNHTLPTSGTARFSSPLSVDDFIKKSQYIYYTEEALDGAAPDIERFALAEGLGAHARSAMIRTCKKSGGDMR